MAKGTSDVHGTATLINDFSGPIKGQAKVPLQGEDLCLALTPKVLEQKSELLQSQPSAAVTHLHPGSESGQTPHGINHVSESRLALLP